MQKTDGNRKTMRKIRKTNIVIGCLLCSGLLVFFYPAISNRLAEQNHSKAVQAYDRTVEEMRDEHIEAELKKARAYNKNLVQAPVTDVFVPDTQIPVTEAYLNLLNIGGVMGYIEIPDIDLRLPIYHLTSEAVLRQGVGHMSGTAVPVGGTGNHTVLTGHRGLPSAKLFSDLDKLAAGNMFYIHVLGSVLVYEVDQIAVIEPQDTELLRPIEGEDYVTLLTCTPYAVNSHRLLVRGTRLPAEEEQAAVENYPADTVRRYKILLLLIPALGTAALLLWRYRHQQKKQRHDT